MSAPRPTPTCIGPYQLIRLLGVGSIAQVYHAQRVEGGEAVALKVPRLPLMANPAACERFVERARDNVRMGPHHNIVTTLDVGLDGELPYVAMEYVRGVELGRLVEAMRKANLRWPTAAISWVLAGILRALSHAFGATLDGKPLHLTHRDLRSSQVVVTREGQVKVTDFGLNGPVGRGRGPLGVAPGCAGPSADMPAVGRIGWAMIEGQSYSVPDSSAETTLTFTRRGPSPTLSRGSIPKALVELIHALLDSNEQTRMPNPRRALAALEACPGLNLSEPEPLRRLLARFFSNCQEAAHTIVERRIHPELVALEGTLSPQSGGVAPGPPPRSIIVRRRADGVPPVQYGRGSDDTVPASIDVHLPTATASIPTLTRNPVPPEDFVPSPTASMPSTPLGPAPDDPLTASLPTATFEPPPVLLPSDSTVTDLLGSGLSTPTSAHPLSPPGCADVSGPPPSSPSVGLPPLPANLATGSESTPTFVSAPTPRTTKPASPTASPPRHAHSTGWQPGVGALTIAPPERASLVGEIIFSDASEPIPPPAPRAQPGAARPAMVPLYVPLPKLAPVSSTRKRRWWPWAVVLCVVGLALGGFVLTATLLAAGPAHGHAGPIGERLRPIPLPASPSNCDDASVAARAAPLGFS